MKEKKWMIYGAYGYTGRLVIQEALSRGHTPVIAGRSYDKLIPLAKQYNLDYLVFDLKNEEKLSKAVQDFDLVFHAAGPFKYTSDPMVKACLKSGTNYVDITGEIPVFEQNFSYHNQAKDKNIAIISGVGFDVVPTDCLAKHISEKIPNPSDLKLGIAGGGSPSAGTLKTMIEYISNGLLFRRNGQLVKYYPEKDIREIRFSDKVRPVFPAVWGDLATAFRTTNIPNITIYMPQSKQISSLSKIIRLKKKTAQNWIERNIHGPDEQTRNNARSYIWAQVTNDKGDKAQAWLETMEGYRFTAIAGVKSVEKVFELKPKGALTPALAFGQDFILEIPETKRFDRLEDLLILN